MEWTGWPNTGTGPWGQWGTKPSISTGAWHEFVFHGKLATWTGGSPNNDAVIEAWMDGTQFFSSYPLAAILSGTTEADNYFNDGYLMGSANSGFTDDTALYIDNLVMSTESLI